MKIKAFNILFILILFTGVSHAGDGGMEVVVGIVYTAMVEMAVGVVIATLGTGVMEAMEEIANTVEVVMGVMEEMD